MNSFINDTLFLIRAAKVRVTADALTVELEDGRTIVVPTLWYPRLANGTPKEWKNYEVSVGGIHWPDLDEDLSIKGLLLGRMSGESTDSLKFWLDNRKKGRRSTLQDFVAHRKVKASATRRKKTA